jgi:mono/diheme cytochrome c family protein
MPSSIAGGLYSISIARPAGHGGGPDAFALVPAPADLAWLSGSAKRSAQPYAYWAIAEGGADFQSDMPAFKKRLPSKDIWAVIAYIQAGMPHASP